MENQKAKNTGNSDTAIKPKKIAVINDMAGYGRCALTAAIPVISALKVQCCPVVTAVLSNHAGYPSCYYDDYTERMTPYIEEWKKQQFTFDGIMTGFLGSAKQVEIVTDFLRHFKADSTTLLVDPTLGDNGKTYRVCDQQLCEGMRELIQYANIITPNLTEACILTETPYQEKGWSKRKLSDLTYKLLMMGAGAVVLTGVVKGGLNLNVIHEKGKSPIYQTARHVEGSYHGTGDIFAAVLGASVVRGTTLEESVRRAAAFTRKCIERTQELGAPEPEGLCLEECLPYLIKLP